MPNQATASDLPFYDIFVSQKVPLSKISDDFIACDFWFSPLPIKNPGHAYARGGGGGGGGEGVAFRDVPPKFTACVPQARVNFSTSTRGPAYFCAKTGHHERFSMKQQNRSRERDQVV